MREFKKSLESNIESLLKRWSFLGINHLKKFKIKLLQYLFFVSLHFDGGYVVTLAIVSQKMVSIPVNLGGLEVFTLSDVEEADLPYCRTKR